MLHETTRIFFHNHLVLSIKVVLLFVVFLDFKKVLAFRVVHHALFLHKLRSLNIETNMLQWIVNYLHRKKECVIINEVHSSYVDETSGVPQRSVLGHLIFLNIL